jgi:hypothetical protein
LGERQGIGGSVVHRGVNTPEPISDGDGLNGVRGKSLMPAFRGVTRSAASTTSASSSAPVIWSKPNGLPESVTDRVRRSHEQWFHFTLQPRYFSAVDEIREHTATRTGRDTVTAGHKRTMNRRRRRLTQT